MTFQGQFHMASSSGGASTTRKTRDVAKMGNPYAKLAAVKCYRCLKHGYKSNGSSNRRPVNLTDYEGDEDVTDDDDL